MVRDMNRAVSFYRDHLGFEESCVSPNWSELLFGNAVLALHGGGDEKRIITGLSIQYEDVNLAFNTAIKAGATEVCKPENREGEPIIFASVADPDGNVIMLTQFVGHH